MLQVYTTHYNCDIIQQRNSYQPASHIILVIVSYRDGYSTAWGITQDEYDRKATELKDKKFDLELDLRLLSDEDDKFEKAVLNLLNIFSRASELFRKADIEKKRQLINFVLSNLEIDGDKLVYQAKKPFDVLLETAESNKWYKLVDRFRTECFLEIVGIDFKFDMVFV